jgi:hypothetical protein
MTCTEGKVEDIQELALKIRGRSEQPELLDGNYGRQSADIAVVTQLVDVSLQEPGQESY